MTKLLERAAPVDQELPANVEAAFDPGSFRDRYSRVVVRDGRILRLLSPEAEQSWKALANTQLYLNAVKDGLLIPSRTVDVGPLVAQLEGNWSACLEHPRIPFISYPYEWSFGMLKDAALLQLQLVRDALREGLITKDATPYNIQWYGSRPAFIDIGSLVPYHDGLPWGGYRQFCQMFLFPLMLQAYKQLPFQPWMRGSLEGISADHMLSVFTLRDYLRRGVLPHVVLQAKLQNRYADHDYDVRSDLRKAGFNKALIERNVVNLIKVVKSLNWSARESEWSDYGKTNSYHEEDTATKSRFVKAALSHHRSRLVWDVGCNKGDFSRIATEHADYVLALDADPLVIERLYSSLRSSREQRILPLYYDVADPSPGLGWRNQERAELTPRGKPDFILALAVIHHMVIGANLPLEECLRWFAGTGRELVIEFVDRADPMVVQLLRNRDDIFWDYTLDNFEKILNLHFEVLSTDVVKHGQRKLYHARSRALSGV